MNVHLNKCKDLVVEKNYINSNKRIAKNTAFLYIRMLFLMFISFFTSRILLRELGIEDYGIYNVVGSVVAIFSSIQGLLASSTQRFLNYEHGKGNSNQLNKIFSMSVWIHIGLSLLFLTVILPIGLWIINSYLVIPANRVYTANWVFIFSILSAIVTIMTVPYNAVIIANEKMSAFAYISILDGLLRLGIIFLLIHTAFDQLITYAVLLFGVGFLVRVVNMVYCKRNFQEAKRISFLWDKKLLKDMSSFAGWQFLGNSGWALQQQGLNIILNYFFGLVLNSARGISNQVNGAITLFVNNMMIAVNPQITKLYAEGSYDKMFDLFYKSSKYSFLLFCFLAFPFFLETNYILGLWLTTVPNYTVVFVKLVLLYTSLRTLHMPIDSLLKASGEIKLYQTLEFVFIIVTIPVVYLFFKRKFGPEFMFVIMIVFQILATFSALILCKKHLNLPLKIYFKKVIFPCILVVVLFCILLFASKHWTINGILNLLVYSVLYLCSLFTIVLSQQEKRYFKLIINKYILNEN